MANASAGAVTVTVCPTAVPTGRKFGMPALTMVVPVVSGWNAAPPKATVVGETRLPAGNCTVTVSPVRAVVTSCPTVDVLETTDATRGGAPKRMLSAFQIWVPVGESGVPTKTWKTSSGASVVSEEGSPLISMTPCHTRCSPVADA